MEKNWEKNVIILGILFLFVGTSVVPSITGNMDMKKAINHNLQGSGGNILVYSTYDGGVGYGTSRFDGGLPTLMQNYSYEITLTERSTTPQITSSLLATYDELWLLAADYDPQGCFSQQEIDTILNFRNEENGLLIMTDHWDYQSDANQISILLGVQFYGEVYHGAPELIYPNFDEHPLFTGVTSIMGFESEGNINVTSPVDVVATHNGENLIAIRDDGGGRVVFDTSFSRVNEDDILEGTNEQYIINIADWLNPSSGNQPPNIPSNPSPANGSMSVSINADLSWTGGDPDPDDTVAYDVYFGTSSSPSIVSHNQSSLSYDPGTLAYYTYYYWKIVAWDNHGTSTVGPLWHFRTTYVPNQPPYAPSNPSPANGSTEIPVNTDLSWICSDPDSGDFLTYDVYFDSSFPLTKIESNISGTSCVLTNLNYSIKYYWKVVAWDNHQNTNASPLWSFTTKKDTSGPSLEITSPKKGYLYVNLLAGNIQRKFPIFITTLVIGQVDLNATASDSQSGMNRVEFYIDNDLKATDYTTPYSWIWSEPGYFFPYLVTVKAYDNLGNPSTWSLHVWKIL